MITTYDPVNIYMTPKQYASHRICSERMVFYWLKQGLPSIKQGKLRRIKWKEADAWIDAGGLSAGVPPSPSVRKPRRAYTRRPASSIVSEPLQPSNATDGRTV